LLFTGIIYHSPGTYHAFWDDGSEHELKVDLYLGTISMAEDDSIIDQPNAPQASGHERRPKFHGEGEEKEPFFMDPLCPNSEILKL
jgi:hypothetical protein